MLSIHHTFLTTLNYDYFFTNNSILTLFCLPLLLHHPILYLYCGVSLVDAIRFAVFGGDTACRQDGVRVKGNAWTDGTLGTDPGSFFYMDFAYHKIEGCPLVVVVAAQQHGPLAYNGIVANRYRRQIVYPYVLADPRMIANGEVPWILHIHMRLDYHTLTNLCTKHAEQSHLDRADEHPSTVDEPFINEVPHQSLYQSTTSFVPRVVVF